MSIPGIPAAASHRPPWQPRVLFHRLMLPNWLCKNPKVKWNSPKEGDDLNLIMVFSRRHG